MSVIPHQGFLLTLATCIYFLLFFNKLPPVQQLKHHLFNDLLVSRSEFQTSLPGLSAEGLTRSKSRSLGGLWEEFASKLIQVTGGIQFLRGRTEVPAPLLVAGLGLLSASNGYSHFFSHDFLHIQHQKGMLNPSCSLDLSLSFLCSAGENSVFKGVRVTQIISVFYILLTWDFNCIH